MVKRVKTLFFLVSSTIILVMIILLHVITTIPALKQPKNMVGAKNNYKFKFH